MNKTLSYKNLLYITPIKDKWEVKYEVYFNPHATPKQLMDIKIFDTFDEAFNWSNKYLADNFIGDDDGFILTAVDMEYDQSKVTDNHM